jgi:hypothetical protein
LNEAARRRRIFHLWFHPTNLAEQTEAMFGGLRRILCRAAALRQRGHLQVLTMSEIAERWERSGDQHYESEQVVEGGEEHWCAE